MYKLCIIKNKKNLDRLKSEQTRHEFVEHIACF